MEDVLFDETAFFLHQVRAGNIGIGEAIVLTQFKWDTEDQSFPGQLSICKSLRKWHQKNTDSLDFDFKKVKKEVERLVKKGLLIKHKHYVPGRPIETWYELNKQKVDKLSERLA
ncbi:hypothetical protein [Peptococcus simiae]|uniref:hypothetical protein n=1 Tax=Peptococcus simiae TaxID=1643805 RepID=UPI00397F03A9